MEKGFYEKVYEVTRRIPEGRVTTYGAIAKYLGASGSSRMVGWAMNQASRMEDVPAHRVVNRNGLLTGKHHFPGTYAMQQLLEAEGVRIQSDQVVDFKELLWDPSREL